MKPTAKLNQRQELFVREYLKDGNGTQAAIRAGYARPAAFAQASRLLSNVKVLEAVRAAQNRILARTEVSVERVLREYACIAFFDPGSLYDEQGTLLPLDEMPDDARRAIAAIETEEIFDGYGGVIGKLRKVRFSNKLGALEALAKHLIMFPNPPQAMVQVNMGRTRSIPLSVIDALTGDDDTIEITGAPTKNNGRLSIEQIDALTGDDDGDSGTGG